MSDWFTASPESLLAIALSAVGVYAAVLVYTRLAGLRSFAKMSSFDFAMTVAVGSMLASAILTKTPSLPQALVGLAMVYGLQRVVGWARQRWPRVQRIVDNEPLLLMDGSEILHANLRRAGVTEDDLRSKLRAAGVARLSDVHAVVFETTGDVSVLAGGAAPEAWIVQDVRRGEAA